MVAEEDEALLAPGDCIHGVRFFDCVGGRVLEAAHERAVERVATRFSVATFSSTRPSSSASSAVYHVSSSMAFLTSASSMPERAEMIPAMVESSAASCATTSASSCALPCA